MRWHWGVITEWYGKRALGCSFGSSTNFLPSHNKLNGTNYTFFCYFSAHFITAVRLYIYFCRFSYSAKCNLMIFLSIQSSASVNCRSNWRYTKIKIFSRRLERSQQQRTYECLMLMCFYANSIKLHHLARCNSLLKGNEEELFNIKFILARNCTFFSSYKYSFGNRKHNSWIIPWRIDDLGVSEELLFARLNKRSEGVKGVQPDDF